MNQSFRIVRANAARILVGGVVFVAGMGFATPGFSATYYVGRFTGSTPADDAACGTGKGAAPNAHPCSTLGYWNKNRRTILVAGDAVRLAPGTYTDSGSA